ncbi:hypothetical protein [Neptuniibacter sp. QD37_11]|uniref:hypothetical protein n=1 Tax=Neptuniibacter sp. QD37_11 TaxID=3398209 RepID=UPI0039F5DF8B
MYPTYSKWTLPNEVYDQATEIMEWRYADNGPEVIGDDCFEMLRACNEDEEGSPFLPKYFKQQTRLEAFPYYGKDDSRTNMLWSVFEYAAEIVSHREDVSESLYCDIREKLDYWKEYGEFPPSKRKKRKLPTGDIAAFRICVEAEIKSLVDQAIKVAKGKGCPMRLQSSVQNDLQLKISWSEGRSSSWGGTRNGKPYISLAVADIKLGKTQYTFNEYSHIAQLKEIGSCKGSREVYLASLIAHELAHVAQHYSKITKDYGDFTEMDAQGKASICMPKILKVSHGSGWQEIYRYLRFNWVNKLPTYRNC